MKCVVNKTMEIVPFYLQTEEALTVLYFGHDIKMYSNNTLIIFLWLLYRNILFVFNLHANNASFICHISANKKEILFTQNATGIHNANNKKLLIKIIITPARDAIRHKSSQNGHVLNHYVELKNYYADFSDNHELVGSTVFKEISVLSKRKN